MIPIPRLRRFTPAALLVSALLHVAACSPPAEMIAQRAPAEPAPIEAGVAPSPGPYAPGIDALHYDVEIQLPDTGSYVRARGAGRFLLTDPRPDSLVLDLTGLAVSSVRAEGAEASFVYEKGRLHVPVPEHLAVGDTLDVTVSYEGHPDDGLILGRNIHGRPTAFADNWPNRARFWFPSIDHPSDKATVEFLVRLPEGSARSVVSNGALLAEEAASYRWSVAHPIPTYTMVIGAAEFVVEEVGTPCTGGVCTEVSTWLFPEDAETGRASFRRAAEMVAFYSELIAPFPYSKLAHVQSSTRFGGMENVGAIFYPEQPIHQGDDIELTVAHETAHQWFGDAVTESDWHHLWLSEGFASYFGALFFEHADGDDAFADIMEAYRASYLRSGASSQPIVNPREDNLFSLLNANNYSKGAWVLHMLRGLLGEETFYEGIRHYYEENRHGTALTDDLKSALEAASGTDLDTFFDQWVYRPGHPRLEIEWSANGSSATATVRQVQPESWPTFSIPLELEFVTPAGPVRHVLDVDQRFETFSFDLPAEPTDFNVDPEGTLLLDLVSPES